MSRWDALRRTVPATFGLIGLALGVAGWLGGPALEVLQPMAPVRVAAGGVKVFVRFDRESVEPATFRAGLNGVDVTSELTVAAHGAYGTLYGLLDGDNELELAVFARGPWRPRVLVEELHALRVRSRPSLDWNRG